MEFPIFVTFEIFDKIFEIFQADRNRIVNILQPWNGESW